jgi:hypothetical protein
MRLYDTRDGIYNSFTLLWCEDCGRAAVPPKLPPPPDFVADTILFCTHCGEPLALLEAIISPKAVHHQQRLGMSHRWVASLGGLQR